MPEDRVVPSLTVEHAPALREYAARLDREAIRDGWGDVQQWTPAKLRELSERITRHVDQQSAEFTDADVRLLVSVAQIERTILAKEGTATTGRAAVLAMLEEIAAAVQHMTEHSD